ncbi:MAG: hypothetical protein H0U57_05955 [Tatlockia sp.]|nr:hypothetical protein [Tatlockia sp.]
MLKKVFKPTIIALFQLVMLAILAVIVVSLLLNNSESIRHWQDFFNQFKNVFLIGHSLFYMALIVLWPKLVAWLASRQAIPPEPQQLIKATQMRFYLVGILVLFECLIWLR